MLAQKPHAVSHAAVIKTLPPIYASVRDTLCRSRRDGYRDFAAILLLHREFPGDAITAALEEAQARGCVHPAVVRQLLLNSHAPATPPPVRVPPALATAVVGPLDLTCYDRLAAVLP